ncbi:MAG: RNA pseudouridine synthase [Brevinematales bacterium]|nr:RNA pseudouridine synthase [Brevinematales bacterium]
MQKRNPRREARFKENFLKSIPFYSTVFISNDIVVVNKASGISIGGDRWDESKERLDRLLEKELEIPKIYTVHRIDRDTSGLVIFAKTREVHRSLSILFEQRKIEKRYIAIVHGRPSWKETMCDLPLVPNGNKKHMTIIDKYQGKESVTHFSLISGAGNYSVLEVKPETGRIHQIRVHAAAIGHPVVCDNLYGKEKPVMLSSIKRGWRDPLEEKPILARLGLHALEIKLPDGQIFSAPLARDMSALVKQMEKL